MFQFQKSRKRQIVCGKLKKRLSKASYLAEYDHIARWIEVRLVIGSRIDVHGHAEELRADQVKFRLKRSITQFADVIVVGASKKVEPALLLMVECRI